MSAEAQGYPTFRPDKVLAIVFIGVFVLVPALRLYASICLLKRGVRSDDGTFLIFPFQLCFVTAQSSIVGAGMQYIQILREEGTRPCVKTEADDLLVLLCIAAVRNS